MYHYFVWLLSVVPMTGCHAQYISSSPFFLAFSYFPLFSTPTLFHLPLLLPTFFPYYSHPILLFKLYQYELLEKILCPCFFIFLFYF